MGWLRWALVVAAAAHIFEGSPIPAGSCPGTAANMPENGLRLTRRFLIGINALLLYGCFEAGHLGPTPQGIALWLTMASFVFCNAWFHIAGAIKTRGYSPGIITAICLYFPLSVFGYFKVVGGGRASTGTALVAILIGTAHEAYVYGSFYLRRRHAGRRS